MRHECIILADGPGALSELCGISLLERLLRQLQRLGLTKAIVLSATPDASRTTSREALAESSQGRGRYPPPRDRSRATRSKLRRPGLTMSEHVLILRGDTVFDSRLLQLLDEQDSATALVDSSPPAKLETLVSLPYRKRSAAVSVAARSSRATGLQRHHGALCDEALRRRRSKASRIDVQWTSLLVDGIFVSLRRICEPYWFPAPGSEQTQIAERLLLDAAQKGSLDFPAMVHAPIENFLISHLWKTAITPNQLTIATNIVAWGATFLFATGHLASGTILALVVGILDGLDGKQARVKIETSKAGKLEHWFDACFENSWWIAIAYHLQSSGKLPGAFAYLVLLMGAEAVGGLGQMECPSLLRPHDRRNRPF